MRRSRFLALFVFLPFLLGGIARAEAPSFSDVEDAFDAALDSEDPEVQQRAYEKLHASADPRTVDLILKSLKKIRKEQEKIRKEQTSLEDDYEKEFNDKLEADAAFERSSKSSRELDRYNDKVRKITRNLDRLRLQQKSLENQFTRTRALMTGAVTAMTHVLSNLAPEELGPALDRVAQVWRDGREEDDRLRWVYALADLEGNHAAERLKQAVEMEDLDVKVRAAALEALAARKDPNAHHLAVRFLERPDAPWDLVTASIEALRVLHEERSIQPLITLLGREGIKREREDAHAALMSLTGEKHGPYAEPWQKWWDENKDRWTIPPEPVRRERGQEANAGVTFYGINSFSDRIMFILDISGSMERAPTKKDEIGRTVQAGPPNIETARKELIGAINNLDGDEIFNVIFFNHEVVLWQRRMQEATDSKRKQAIQWVEEQEPSGTTNIYDAFETAFQIALAATGDPLIDTIFFMTDGRPTSGKVRDPKRILEEVLEWNKAARIKIHTVGVGDHDEELLSGLARASGGEYVKR